jgi:hypothetical protein
MAATIELKYFNSFWLKKLDTVVDVLPAEYRVLESDIVENTITFDLDLGPIGVGQYISYEVGGVTFTNTVFKRVSGPKVIKLSTQMPDEVPVGTIVKFGVITDFSYIPEAYQSTPESDWYIEEARIRGGYNNTSVDFGVKAYIVEDINGQQYRSNSMIYSGIFNSRTGVNNTNQFSIAEDIVRSVEPSQGSIQKLYAEDTNLIIFQERKVSRALIDKDAIYSAEGQPMTTSGTQVIGQIQSYAGNYGISTNPESFAVYGYRKYFTDRNQNAVLRLSQDGITEISANGMIDYFRDNLSNVGQEGRVVGSWDMHNKLYVLSMQPPLIIGSRNDITDRFQTISFDEDINGWTSLYSFKPQLAGSLRENYFTFKNGNIWQHYAPTTKVGYCNFYGVQYNSKVTLVLNPNVSESKSFNTINYEGSPGWALTNIYTDSDKGLSISSFVLPTNLSDLQNQLFTTSFKNKENKYFGTIINDTSVGQGEVVYGNSMSGIKGYYATAVFQFPDPFLSGGSRSQTSLAELFAVSSNYVHSYY